MEILEAVNAQVVGGRHVVKTPLGVHVHVNQLSDIPMLPVYRSAFIEQEHRYSIVEILLIKFSTGIISPCVTVLRHGGISQVYRLPIEQNDLWIHWFEEYDWINANPESILITFERWYPNCSQAFNLPYLV